MGEQDRQKLPGLILSILGPISILLLIIGDIGTAIMADGRWRAFFEIANAFTDAIFVLSLFLLVFIGFFANKALPGIKLALLLLFSSVIPLVFVSGPFLIAWAKDGSFSTIVRGLYAWPKPSAAIELLACLRLLRLFIPAVIKNNAFNSGRRPKAFYIFISLCFIAAILSESFILPAYSRNIAADRNALTEAIAAYERPESFDFESFPDLLAVSTPQYSWQRDPEFKRFGAVSYSSDGGLTRVWFDALRIHRARAVQRAAVHLAAFIAFLYWLAGMRADGLARKRYIHLRAEPTGRDELNGLLGR